MAFRDMKRFSGLLLLLTFVMSLAHAQEPTYRIQPEDVLRIQVLNEPQLQAEVPVGKDGNISAPFVGIVRAEGKTTTELEADLAELYVKIRRLRDPRVSVTISRFREIYATVGGAVNRPGRVAVRPTDTILSLLNNAGGALLNGQADLKRATLQRGNSREVIPIDLYSMLIKGDMSQNYVLQDGDLLTVPEESKNRVMVLGAVQRPGTIGYKEPMNLSDAISQAGGEIQYRSKMSETMIIRERPGKPGEYLRIRANFVAFLSKGDATQNVALMPGDIVFIPDTKTPSGGRIGEFANSLANSLFILDRFGINIFKR